MFNYQHVTHNIIVHVYIYQQVRMGVFRMIFPMLRNVISSTHLVVQQIAVNFLFFSISSPNFKTPLIYPCSSLASRFNLSKSFNCTPHLFYKKTLQIGDHFCLNMDPVVSSHKEQQKKMKCQNIPLQRMAKNPPS